uniref:DNA polymerase beta n=1 Tax=viral metagenome TaxID=1070528 RepID=A0A6C0D834_9ZZZZ
MKKTLRKYNKKSLKRNFNKKTIKIRHKKYIGGSDDDKIKVKKLGKEKEKKEKKEKVKKEKVKVNGKRITKKPVFNIVEEFESEKKEKEINTTDLKVVEETNIKMEPGTERLNEKFIDLMDILSNIMLKQGEPFRARAYQKAQETIMQYPGDITSPEQLKGLPKIGETIMKKLDEYVKTGTLKVIEREKTNPVNILGEIYGIGPKKAKELVDKSGITSIEQLREKQDTLLNDTQKIGLKYYEDIMKRIPRSEIEQYDEIFKNTFQKVSGPDSEARYEIVGSYRRGAQSSGDIDVIITSKTGEVFKKFIDELIQEKIILEVLSRGQTKCLVITKLPNSSSGIARRIDFLYTNPKEYPFSVLYFTGSKIFNTVMRGRALALGYSLNEHGISIKKKGEKVIKGEMISDKQIFNNETDIFDFLGIVYKEPNERIDGRSVILKDEIGKIQVEPESVLVPVLKENKKKEKKEKETKAKSIKKRNKSDKSVMSDITDNSLTDTHEEFEQMNQSADENTVVISLVKEFKKGGIHFLDSLGESELASMIQEANKAFHFNKTPIMTDNEFDILKEYLEKKFPTSGVLKEIGTPIIEKNKVTLPYEMASMDKIKPDTGALTSWKTKFKGPYVISCKLDGVSGLYYTEGGESKLYTRGNGKVGQDVSHLIPYLNFPKTTSGSSKIVVRGEFIIPKKIFHDKYAMKFANPRNLVAGIVNRQTIDEKVHDLHFVAYEVVVPQLKPSEQMQKLAENGFETVLNRSVMFKDLTNELLSEVLMDWRSNYLYEIDGVIVTDDHVYDRKSGNPEHSFAFKMVLSDQIAEAKVVDVLWTPSKDGYLKPRVQIEPIQLGGVKIEYATGFNGAFIEQNKIGMGALIQIIRSGDVIPHIRSVTTPAEQAKMPLVPYKWNNTHVDIMLEDISSDETVREKNITGFFRGIGVEGLKGGNVVRIIAAGYDTVPKIIHMSKEEFLKVEGFKDKLATKIYDGIKEKLSSASLITLMSASNIFGRGFSDKRVELILEVYPDILISQESTADKIKKITGIKGMATKSAEAFVDKIGDFVAFLKECGLESKLNSSSISNASVANIDIDTSHPLYKKSVVMTGTRDPAVIDALKKVGAILGSSVSKNTVVVVAKSADEDSGKANEARKLGIPIMTPSEFLSKYF